MPKMPKMPNMPKMVNRGRPLGLLAKKRTKWPISHGRQFFVSYGKSTDLRFRGTWWIWQGRGKIARACPAGPSDSPFSNSLGRQQYQFPMENIRLGAALDGVRLRKFHIFSCVNFRKVPGSGPGPIRHFRHFRHFRRARKCRK